MKKLSGKAKKYNIIIMKKEERAERNTKLIY